MNLSLIKLSLALALAGLTPVSWAGSLGLFKTCTENRSESLGVDRDKLVEQLIRRGLIAGHHPQYAQFGLEDESPTLRDKARIQLDMVKCLEDKIREAKGLNLVLLDEKLRNEMSKARKDIDEATASGEICLRTPEMVSQAKCLRSTYSRILETMLLREVVRYFSRQIAPDTADAPQDDVQVASALASAKREFSPEPNTTGRSKILVISNPVIDAAAK